MIHWKVKLVHVAVIAAVVASALLAIADPLGCAW